MKINAVFLFFLMTNLLGFSAKAQSDLMKEHKFAADYANVILQIAKEIDMERPALQLKEIDRQTFETIFTEKINRFATLYD
jgi:hypothetical protein